MEKNLLRDILLWKKQFNSVYTIEISNKWYVYRSLSKGEFSSILALKEKNADIDVESFVFSQCLLFPRYTEGMFDEELAGEIDGLYVAIMNTIGFSATEKFVDEIEKTRNSLGSLENQIVILICKAFPHLTLSDIDNLTYDELLRYLSISEAILDVKINIEKPSPTKPGTIDFDQENKVMNHPVPLDRKKRSPRGDVSK